MLNGNEVIDREGKKLFRTWALGAVLLIIAGLGVCVGANEANANEPDPRGIPPVIVSPDVHNDETTILYETFDYEYGTFNYQTYDYDYEHDTLSYEAYDYNDVLVADPVIFNEYSSLVCEEVLAPKIVGEASHLAVLLSDPVTEYEETVVLSQIENCSRNVKRVADPYYILALLRLEADLGVPDEARGILGAVWCIESAMRLEAAVGGTIRGDPRNGVRMAHGPFQLWPWMRNWCGLTQEGSDDLFVAATCYWQRVEDRYNVRAVDGCSKQENRWKYAEALTANGPKYRKIGCNNSESGHWRQMKQMTPIKV